MVSFNITPLQLWNGKALGDAVRVSRDVAQLFQPLLSTNRKEENVLYEQVQARGHAHVSTLFTGVISSVQTTPRDAHLPIRMDKLS